MPLILNAFMPLCNHAMKSLWIWILLCCQSFMHLCLWAFILLGVYVFFACMYLSLYAFMPLCLYTRKSLRRLAFMPLSLSAFGLLRFYAVVPLHVYACMPVCLYIFKPLRLCIFNVVMVLNLPCFIALYRYAVTHFTPLCLNAFTRLYVIKPLRL